MLAKTYDISGTTGQGPSGLGLQANDNAGPGFSRAVRSAELVGDFCLTGGLDRRVDAAQRMALAVRSDQATAFGAVSRAGRALREALALPQAVSGDGPAWALSVLGVSGGLSVVDDGRVVDAVKLGCTVEMASRDLKFLRAPGVDREVSVPRDARVVRRRDRDVLALLVERGSVPRRLGERGVWYAALYGRAGPHKYGSETGVKLSRLERFAASQGGAYAASEQARMQAVLDDVALLTAVEDAVREKAGVAGLHALNLIVGQGASIDGALAVPELAALVRGGRGGRRNGRVVTLLRAALEAVPPPGSGPFPSPKAYTDGRGAGGV